MLWCPFETQVGESKCRGKRHVPKQRHGTRLYLRHIEVHVCVDCNSLQGLYVSHRSTDRLNLFPSFRILCKYFSLLKVKIPTAIFNRLIDLQSRDNYYFIINVNY